MITTMDRKIKLLTNANEESIKIAINNPARYIPSAMPPPSNFSVHHNSPLS